MTIPLHFLRNSNTSTKTGKLQKSDSSIFAEKVSIKRQPQNIRKAICKFLQKPGKGNRKSRLLIAYLQGSMIASC